MELLEAQAALLQRALERRELGFLLMQGDEPLGEFPIARGRALLQVFLRVLDAELGRGGRFRRDSPYFLVGAGLGDFNGVRGLDFAALELGFAGVDADLALGQSGRVQPPLQLEAQVFLDLRVIAFALQGFVRAPGHQVAGSFQLGGGLGAGVVGQPRRRFELLGAFFERAHALQSPAQGQARGVEALYGFDVPQGGLKRGVGFLINHTAQYNSPMLRNQYNEYTHAIHSAKI